MATVFNRGGQENRAGQYYVSYFDRTGERITKSARTTDKTVALRIAAKLEAEAALRRDGVVDAQLDAITQQSKRPIEDHLTDYEAKLRAADRSDQHVAMTISYTRVCCTSTSKGACNDHGDRNRPSDNRCVGMRLCDGNRPLRHNDLRDLLEQAELQHEKTTAPLYACIDLIKQARAEAGRARQALWESCPYPALNHELARVAEQLQVLHRHLASITKEAADFRQWAESDRQEISRVAHESEEVELRERADRRDAKAKSLEGEAAKLREQIDQLDQQEKRLRDQMLEP